MTEKRTITVGIDPSMHPGGESTNEYQKLLWAALDTAWNLLSEYAVRITLVQIREAMHAQGHEFPDEAGLFEQAVATGDPNAPRSYDDLKEGDYVAAEMLTAMFDRLIESTMRAASGGMGFTLVGDDGKEV